MTVESHLTKLEPYSFGSPATITADLNITNEFGQTEVQLQDLVVSSFSSAKPEDDYELYLHTVLDLDPEHEIITMSPEPRGVGKHIDESCERVAQMYLKHSTSTSSADTPPISPPTSPPTTPMRLDCPGQGLPDAPFSEQAPVVVGDEMEQFISSSPYFYALNLIRSPRVVELSHTNPLAFPSVYQSIVDDAHLIHNFSTHLGRVVKQISHRFPRMNVLDFTLAEWAFTENVLDGLQDSFSSYKLVASTQPQSLLDRCPDLSSNKRVSFEDLDLDTQPDDTTNATGAYELIVMSTAIFSKFELSQAETIRKIRLLLRMRGFLIIIHSPSMLTFENRFDPSDALINQSSSDPIKPLDLDALLPGSMFLPAAENSTQSHVSGFSMIIRQANDDLQVPTFKRGRSQESVVIVGHPAARFGLERHKAIHHIRVQKNLEVFDHVEDLTPKAAFAATMVILLMDLTDPICSNMTAKALSALKSLMQPGKVILWVTSAALRDPETAASFGLTRTLKAENPDLILQVLDSYNTASLSTDLIIDQIMLLLHYRDHIQGDDDLRRKMLFSFESEIHVNGKRRIVPRVLPYRPAIDRLNANRREVSRTFNSLETGLRIDSVRGSDELTRFEVRPVEECNLCFANQPTVRFVDVEYSSLYPVSSGVHDIYLCIGLAADNGRPVVGLSPHSASKAPVLQTIDIPQNFSDRRVLASLLAPMVSAADVGTWARPGDIVLIDPDLVFLHCIRAVLLSRPGERGFTTYALTTNPDLIKDRDDIEYLHPMSSGRELKRLIPCTYPTVIDFLADGNGLSKVIERLGGDFEYVRWPPLSTARRDQQFFINTVVWTDLLTRCLNIVGRMPSQNLKSTFVTPALLDSTSELTSAFTIVDWKSDRHVPVPVKPLVEPRLLKPDSTYILVGLTRDLGQSLCRLFIRHGARNIVVASRSPNNAAIWISELNSEGANIRAQRLDVTNLESVRSLRATLPIVGGIVNGAMVLDDRVLAKMDIDTWRRVTRPKTVGSINLDKVFNAKNLDFFIMMSSFAAIGGHAGQSNYAAANMFMNGLATNRRQRGLVGSVLNIGVIYGLGLLARERQDIYHGLEREGYPPISERDIHHMFLEAIVAGRPTPGQIMDLTTGLARYRVNDPNPLHWHRDSRFCHFTVDEANDDGPQRNKGDEKNLKELVDAAASVETVSDLLSDHLCRHLEASLQLSENSISFESHIVELGVDSLMAVEIRNWFYKRVGSDVPVMKILKPVSISDCKCHRIQTERSAC